MLQVSVVMPVCNQEKYLAATIESVLQQTFREFELLILDDGSTDGSAAIIRDYASRDARIRVYFEPNAGRCLALNYLVDKARGEFCALLDADDLMMPDRLEKQLAFHRNNPEIDASSCHCHYINENGRTLGEQRHPFLQTADECRRAAANGDLIQCAITGLMISKQAYTDCGGLKPQYWPCDDFEFSNRLLEKGYLLVIIQETLMKYRIHASAITVKNPLHVFDMIGYAMHCIALRRAGKPEISFESFVQIRAKDSWLVRINRKRYNYAQIFFRNSGIAMMSRNYGSFLYQIILSILLSPNYLLLKLKGLTKARLA